MANASTPGPVIASGSGHVLRVLALPAGVALLAVLVSGSLGHVAIGLLLGGGVALGALNGLLLEHAMARLTPDASVDRKDIAKSSLGRLGLVSVVALVLAFFFRPDGWLLLLGLACYQLLTLAASLGAAAREARLG